MSYDVTSLISERLDAIEEGATTTTNSINSFLDEFLRRGGIGVTIAPIRDLPIQTEPIPDLPEDITVSDLDYIPTTLNLPDHDIESFDLNSLISEFDSISTDIGNNIDQPAIDSVEQTLEPISVPDIPDDLPEVDQPSLSDVTLPTMPLFSKLGAPLPEMVTTDFGIPDIPSITFLETQRLFEEFDNMLQRDLQFARYAHEVIRDRRSKVRELIQFYENVLSALKSTNPLQRSRKVLDEINHIVEEGEQVFIKPIYDRFMDFASADVKANLEGLYQRATVLSTAQIQEKFYSENVFTDRDKEDDIENLELELKQKLAQHESDYENICIQVWNVTMSYVLLYINKMLIELQRRIDYENVLVGMHQALSQAVLRYYSLYDEIVQAGELQLNRFKAIMQRADAELTKIQSILEKNNAYIEAYNAQINGISAIVEKYDVDRRLYQSQLVERTSRVDLARSVYQNNQAKVDLYRRAIDLANRLYSLRQEKVRDILNRARSDLGVAKAQQALDVEVSRALSSIYNIYGDILNVDTERYRAEFDNELADALMDYRTKVRLNAERANLLRQAYSVFLQRVGREDSYILSSTRMINDMANRLAMEAFRPLSVMSAGLLSAIDAVVNGLYEFVAEG